MRVNQAEFARMMGVERGTVSKWVKAARVSVGTDGKIDVEAAKSSLAATESPLPHHQARMAQIASEKASRGSEGPAGGDGADTIALRRKRAQMRREEAQAEMAEMDRDKQAGLLVEREEIDYVLADLGTTLRTLIENQPDRLAPVIAAHLGDVNAIRSTLADSGTELLREFADLLSRKAESLAP